MKLFMDIRRSLNALSAKDNKKLFFISCIQSALGLLDLMGVVLLGALGSLAIRGVQSKGAGDRVSKFLDFIGIGQVSFQGQVAILGTVAAIFFTVKTVLSMFISRKILYFLASKSADLSSRLISKSLNRNLMTQQKQTFQELQYAVGLGATSLMLGVIGTTTVVISDVFLLFIMFFGIFIIDPFTASLSILLFGSIGSVLYFSLHKRARHIGEKLADFNLESYEKLNEVLLAYREIYVRNSRYHYADKISNLRHRYSSFSAEQVFIPNISKYILELSITIGVLLISAVLFLTRDASLAASGLLAFMAAGSRIAPAILRLQQNFIQVQISIGSSTKTFDLISELEGINELKLSSVREKSSFLDFNPEVIIKNVTFSYEKTNKFAIKNINLKIGKGELVALVGPSGSGKSTLVDLILGLNEPSIGYIEISGLAPDKVLETWPGAIGYVPQEVGLINGTIREKI